MHFYPLRVHIKTSKKYTDLYKFFFDISTVDYETFTQFLNIRNPLPTSEAASYPTRMETLFHSKTNQMHQCLKFIFLE